MTTSCNASPGTSMPSQNEADATRMQPGPPSCTALRRLSINSRLGPWPCTSTRMSRDSPKWRCRSSLIARSARKVVVSTSVRPPSVPASRATSAATWPLCAGSAGLTIRPGTYNAAWCW